MTSSNALASVWSQLKEESLNLIGYYERRIYATSKYSLFAGIYKPSNLVNFSLIIPLGQALKIQEFEVKGFKLVKESVPEGLSRIRIELTQTTYQDIFLWVASDIIDKLLEHDNNNEAAAIIEKRINHWQKFIQASGPDGLSRNDQIGLFGELLILNSMLNYSSNKNSGLDSWQGPQGSNHDFTLGPNAIEVKTTTGNEPTRVHISNEYQLDSNGLGNLFLCHIRLDERQSFGVSLPILIDEIVTSLSEILKISFLESLAKLGYLDEQRNLYEARGYIERSRTYYAVSDDFPKLTRNNLMIGVSQVCYQIDLSAASKNKISELQVLQTYFENTL
ncbi:MAG: PD-(D/E)XK motif protein [Methylotenera sp.]|uniref:PD-(D/E)XK motif protein n=1 Tax=Methylotenera sp. TaxID=2051956 RepID=UPI00273336D7|nr:PD-(D/E)XK motif protein [Methylotenera sp.]MDP2102095.1 PD-(D/E)XK motif protein [Methylotenera sp.]MDP2281055.1 PD-(D/E)XK motif protein [Methylotenera sp.]MDP3061150.1 PD-(D/E)XK motif protein [Methylotenera sp.]MDP3210919.1 PD-(D/E)XK motif protein [Methylotenera sp.]